MRGEGSFLLGRSASKSLRLLQQGVVPALTLTSRIATSLTRSLGCPINGIRRQWCHINPAGREALSIPLDKSTLVGWGSRANAFLFPFLLPVPYVIQLLYLYKSLATLRNGLRGLRRTKVFNRFGFGGHSPFIFV